MPQQGIAVITGFVGSNPTSFGREGGTAACSFRLGCTKRFFDAQQRQWRDDSTVWITVKAFRQLATNVMASVRKGDPVVVSGSLSQDEWSKDGVARTSIIVNASCVGHDLSRGTSVFTKTSSQARSDDNAAPDEFGGGERDEDGTVGDDGYPRTGDDSGRGVTASRGE